MELTVFRKDSQESDVLRLNPGNEFPGLWLKLPGICHPGTGYWERGRVPWAVWCMHSQECERNSQELRSNPGNDEASMQPKR